MTETGSAPQAVAMASNIGGAMTVTGWRCSHCHETAEEILVSAGSRGASPMRIRYGVATPHQRRTPARSFGGSRRGTLAHAVAC